MKSLIKRPGFTARLAVTVGFALIGTALPASAWELSGTKTISLHGRDGPAIPIGTVTFTPRGNGAAEKIGIALHMNHDRFKDFFLSMKEFKCLEAPAEVFCHVPYPYANPAAVTATDLSWLEHSLMFLFKAPREFGAKLWNGVYYKLEPGVQGLVGRPQAVDLNQIGAPPDDLAIPPYGPGERSNIAPEARWFNKLTIQ